MTAIAEVPTTEVSPIVERPVGSFTIPVPITHADFIPTLQSLQLCDEWLGRINFYELPSSCKHKDCFRLVIQLICPAASNLVMEITASNATGCIGLRHNQLKCDCFGITVALQKPGERIDFDLTTPLTLKAAQESSELGMFLLHLKAEVQAQNSFTRRPRT